MKCKNCGADIPGDMMICPDCATEVQIVPDYNPLDDVLTREVKGAVKDVTRPIRAEDLKRYRGEAGRESGSSTRVLDQSELDQIRSERLRQIEERHRMSQRNTGETGNSRISGRDDRRMTGPMYRETDNGRRNTGNVRRTGSTGNTEYVQSSTGNVRRNTGEIRRENDERRRPKKSSAKKRASQRRLQRIVTVFLFICILAGAAGFLLYQNSYAGIVNKGYRALQSGEYSSAENYFNRAVSKDVKRPDAYVGLSKIYIQQKNTDKAENVFLSAISSQPDNMELYQAAIQFYVDTEQQYRISGLLEGCDETILSGVSEYVSKKPEFSLPEDTYTEVQEVALSGDGEIYYTTDGTEPTKYSTLYEEPIFLNEGVTNIRAIAINENGIPSLIASRTYTVELPIADAPAVTPSTGQYSEPTQITIVVPDGYTAYYTLDGTVPSAASNLYTGPIDMPQGQTMFSAVLISKSGKMTQVTKRNYVLEY